MATLSLQVIVLLVSFSAQSHATPSPTPYVFNRCVGSVELHNGDDFELIASEYSHVHLDSSVVSLTESLDSLVYFGRSCDPSSSYSPTEYSSLNLLDKTFSWTVDLSQMGCSCSAALYLVPLAHNTDPNTRGDYYCDSSDANVKCTEITLMTANAYAFRLSLQTSTDTSGGVDGGFGGGTDTRDDGSGPYEFSWIGPRDFTKNDYGPGGRCVDTRRPFRVQTVFATTASSDDLGGGDVVEFVKAVLTQDGCSLHTSKVGVNYETAALTQALVAGLTPVVETLASGTADVRWLSSEGADGLGPCTAEMTSSSQASGCGEAAFSDFAIGDASDILGRGTGDDDDDKALHQGQGYCCFGSQSGYADACLGCDNWAASDNWCVGKDRCVQCAGATWCEGHPTAEPTAALPTPEPTPFTAFPTSAPSRAPTHFPSPDPTFTRYPTPHPSHPPSRGPTRSPQHAPTLDPTQGSGELSSLASTTSSRNATAGSGVPKGESGGLGVSAASAGLLSMAYVLAVLVLAGVGLAWFRELKKEAARVDGRKRTAARQLKMRLEEEEARRQRRREEGRDDDEDDDDDEDEDDEEGGGRGKTLPVEAASALPGSAAAPPGGPTSGSGGGGRPPPPAVAAGTSSTTGSALEGLERALLTPWHWSPPEEALPEKAKHWSTLGLFEFGLFDGTPELKKAERKRQAEKARNAVLDTQVNPLSGIPSVSFVGEDAGGSSAASIGAAAAVSATATARIHPSETEEDMYSELPPALRSVKAAAKKARSDSRKAAAAAAAAAAGGGGVGVGAAAVAPAASSSSRRSSARFAERESHDEVDHSEMHDPPSALPPSSPCVQPQDATAAANREEFDSGHRSGSQGVGKSGGKNEKSADSVKEVEANGNGGASPAIVACRGDTSGSAAGACANPAPATSGRGREEASASSTGVSSSIHLMDALFSAHSSEDPTSSGDATDGGADRSFVGLRGTLSQAGGGESGEGPLPVEGKAAQQAQPRRRELPKQKSEVRDL